MDAFYTRLIANSLQPKQISIRLTNENAEYIDHIMKNVPDGVTKNDVINLVLSEALKKAFK